MRQASPNAAIALQGRKTARGLSFEGNRVIPSPIDQTRWANWRNPMDMIRQG